LTEQDPRAIRTRRPGPPYHVAPRTGIVLTVLLVALLYRKEFAARARMEIVEPVRVHRALLWKSVLTAVGMVGLFFAGWPIPKVAIVAGALLLLTRRVKPQRVYREIDWSLLVLFAGLFVVIAGVESIPLVQDLELLATRVGLDRPAVLTVFSTLLSNLVSNVPAVLVFKPFLAHVPDPTRAWLILAMSSTLAGNLTLLGSIANLIVVERARPAVRITFREHLRLGAPLTVLTLLAGLFLLR
jgi:Na+/H+ antiporter NhaD/arsenite permease-like protein